MKLIVAVIKPYKLGASIQALAAIGVTDVLHSEARGYGRQKDHLKDYRDDRFAVAFLPKVRLEFAVEPEHAKAAVGALIAACRTGRQGDGKIWVLDARAAEVEAVRA
ncbi:MAG: P-II family nitrogen regulator [Planctomycetes bacterium]|nr:P-II family nitrogen regulator [Planctomycetota bacterium]